MPNQCDGGGGGMAAEIAAMGFPTLVILAVGVLMKNHHSEFPDTFAGFHLSYAVKDRETWEESNRYAGRFCILSSLCLLALELALTCVYAFFRGVLPESAWAAFFFIFMCAALAAQLVLLFILPYFHLRRKFGGGSAKRSPQ